ncbi:DUF6270 domain-containing protein [Arthrobacter sp. 7Tela_A1]|uniref:DUF6270 domain-containing protein n=1 Tax=Arthrobacter sp. 7Tela_A1 TaxID=3093745 RepID=UPI003BB66123
MANIFVYGGCVTRDAFEHMKDRHSLVQYVARQSLISAASKPTKSLSMDSLGPDFQNRSVRGDLDSSLHRLIRKTASRTELFIFDILSERLGVYRLPGGTYITKSVELAKTGLIKTLPRSASVIKFGTEEHFELWKPAADALLDTLKNAGLFNRTLLFEVPWTNVTDTGEEVPRFRGWDAAYAADLYARYYSYLRALGVRVATIPEQLAVSTLQHKWGPSPYHFVDEAYLWMKEEVLTVLGEVDREDTAPSVTS